MFAPSVRPVRHANQGLRTDFRRGSSDQLIKQLEAFRVVALK